MNANQSPKIKLTLVALVAFSSLKAHLPSAFSQPVIFTNYTYHLGSFPQCVAAGDVNGDGYPDLIVANTLDGTLTVLTNRGNGLFGTNAHEGEDFFLQLHLMNADAAATDLDAVQRQIVGLGTSLGRIAVEQRQIFF